jgi:hypothetical protein
MAKVTGAGKNGIANTHAYTGNVRITLEGRNKGTARAL